MLIQKKKKNFHKLVLDSNINCKAETNFESEGNPITQLQILVYSLR